MGALSNQDFFTMTKEATNEIFHNQETENTKKLIFDILAQYQYDEEVLQTYNEQIDYKVLFLNLYYVTAYFNEWYSDLEEDPFGHPSHSLSMIYFEQQLEKYNVLYEYVDRHPKRKDILRLHDKYGIKYPPYGF